MASTKLTVRGHVIRTQSHFRYQIVSVRDEQAVIIGRSDSLASAIKRAGQYEVRDGRVLVVVDRTTGEEVTSFPKQPVKLEVTKLEITKLEEQIEQEEDAHEEQQTEEFVEPEDTTGTTIDPAALFLVDLTYPNMFEARGVAGKPGAKLDYCKVCGEQVPRARQESHHAGHKRDRSHLISDQIRSRKESTDMAKTKAPTPKEQGVPAAYLNKDGTKFIPGRDASLKRDLIAAIDSLENPNALHTFTEQEAAKILAARNWNEWLLKSRKNREAKAARTKAKADAKAAKVKDEVAAKRKAKADAADAPADAATGDEVKPDPKPAPKARASRRRKVGS